PVIVAFLLARVLPHSIWGTRHLIIIAPVYLLLAAAALVSLRPFWLATTIKLLLACWLTIAAMLWLMRRDAPPIWCAWETLARQVAQTETSVGNEIKVYAFEDLVAYHLWYATSSIDGAKRFRIATVANFPGLPEDKAFFLPRGFDEVTTTDMSAAMREEHFWAAFRVDASGNAEEVHPLLRMLSERGYEIERRFEVTASGQKALIISVRQQRREP
ncbi:MAG: hypothetical protein LC747_08620, partial [Acidobacteria bacterium]|nr:hypothetical protein [Acidobacteriota bacterium]